MVSTLLYVLSILGLVTIVVGLVLTALLVILGKKTESGKVTFNLFRGSLQVTGGPTIIMMALGIAMVLLPVSVFLHARGAIGAEGVADEIEERNEQLETTSKLQNGEFTLSELEVWIDLSTRKQIGLPAFFTSKVSTTSRRVRAVIKDVGPEVKEIHFPHATEGYAIEPLETPAGALWRKVIQDQKRVLYTPELDIFKGKKTFDDVLARSGRLDNSYYLSVPMVEGQGQEILYLLSYYNSFQGRSAEWVGTAFIADTDLFMLYVLFPEDKPFKTVVAKKGDPWGPSDFVEISNPDLETDLDHRFIKWTVRNAKKGEAYTLRWDW